MWKDLHREFGLLHILIILLIISVGWYVVEKAWGLIGSFSDILLIVILAWLLSFILQPVVDKIKLPRIWATFVVYLCIAAIFAFGVMLLIPLVIMQLQLLIEVLPPYLEHSPKFVSNWGQTAMSSLDNSISLIPSIATFLISFLVVLVLSFYFLIDKENIEKEIFDLIPDRWHDEFRFFQQAVDKTFASFLRIQLFYATFSGLAAWFILAILQVDLAIAIGLLAGIFSILPLVGPFLTTLIPVFFVFIDDPVKALIAGIFLVVIQQVLLNIVVPKMMGTAFRLHPAVVLVSFLIGAKIAGGFGAIFAIPLLSIGILLIRELGHRLLKRLA